MTISNTQLALDISNLVAKWTLREEEMVAWLAGTSTGGPFGDGRYALTDVNGVVVYVECPAKLTENVSGQVQSAMGYAAEALGHAENASFDSGLAAADAILAGTHAANAIVDADRAETAKSGAMNSEANALAHYDAFNALYLGPKPADPLTDNKGNALQEGALYWNTTSKVMKVWDGAAWVLF